MSLFDIFRLNKDKEKKQQALPKLPEPEKTSNLQNFFSGMKEVGTRGLLFPNRTVEQPAPQYGPKEPYIQRSKRELSNLLEDARNRTQSNPLLKPIWTVLGPSKPLDLIERENEKRLSKGSPALQESEYQDFLKSKYHEELFVATAIDLENNTVQAIAIDPLISASSGVKKVGQKALDELGEVISRSDVPRKISGAIRKTFEGLPKKVADDLSRALKNTTDQKEIKTVLSGAIDEFNRVQDNIARNISGDDALRRADEILTPKEQPKTSIRQRVTTLSNEVTDRFVSEYAPLTRMEKAILKANDEVRDTGVTLGRRFEQLPGAAGKGEIDLIRFKDDVLENIKGLEDDFNRYLFLRRVSDRLTSNPTLKNVEGFTKESSAAGLTALKEKIGDTAFARVQNAAEIAYQKVMDEALKLQVSSGRLSQESYDTIKKRNAFYAPFRVTEIAGKELPKNLEVQFGGQYVHSIVGINDETFKLADPLQVSAEMVYRSRILAERNMAMRDLAELANIDKTGIIKRLKEAPTSAPAGRGVVEYFDNGVRKYLEVPEDVAQIFERMNTVQRDMFKKLFAMAAQPLRWGATAGNLAFQITNFIFRDLPAQAIFSKHGIKNPLDVVRYPLDVVYAMYSSFMGNVVGVPNKLYEEFLRSGAANSTMQRAFTPKIFRRRVGLPVGGKIETAGHKTLDSVAGLANMLEETTKLAALRRGMRAENIPTFDVEYFTKGLKIKGNTLNARQERAVLERMKEVVTEVRNWGGSPDFMRRGKNMKNLNLLLMFLNARIQGLNTGFGTLVGTYGGKRARTAWARLTTMVGLPTVALALLNNSPEYKADYMTLNETERSDYWVIPQDKFFTDENGNVRREFIKIPKGDAIGAFANIIEAGVQFGYEQDPEGLAGFAARFLENISPLTIHLDSVDNLFESLGSNLNPAVKTPLEFGTGRNFYFHTNTEPDYIEGVRSSQLPAEERYKESTPEVYRKIGRALNLSPLRIEQFVRNTTGGFLNQFTPKEPLEGRSKATENVLTKRFFRSRYVAESGPTEVIKDSLEKQSVDTANTSRQVNKILKEIKAADSSEERKAILRRYASEEPQLIEKVLDKLEESSLGVNYDDRLLRQLNVKNGARARGIVDVMKTMQTTEERKDFLKSLAEKKILSDTVFDQVMYILERE